MQRESGFSLIELLIVVAIIGIVAAIAIPNLVKSKQAANEASAIASVRTIGTGQAKWQAVNGAGKDFAPGLTNLAGDFLTDQLLGSGYKSGMNFASIGVLASASPTQVSYFDTTAWPGAGGIWPNSTRSFYSNETYVIFQQPGDVPGLWGTSPTVRVPSPNIPIQ